MSVSGLAPDTTYYLRAGALYNGATVYAYTVPEPPRPSPASSPAVQVYQLNMTSMTVNWAPLSAAQGYELDVSSTGFNGTGTIYSSTTYDVS